MPRTLVLIISALLIWSPKGVLARGQQEPADEESPSKPYAPPSASKSAEVGDYYFKRKRYNAALSRYQEAVKTDPSYAAAYLGLGRVYEKIGLKRKALDAYRKYLDALPSSKQAEEAKEAHRAISRIERQLKVPPS